MAIYQYTAPDGNKYRVNAPEGATDQQIYGLVLQNYPFAGQTTKELEEAKSAPSTLGDVGRSVKQGFAGGLQSLTNIFGVDNAASQYLGEAQQSAYEGMSPARKEEMARRQELIERSGGDIKSKVGSFTEAPLQTGLQALASSAPIVAGAFLPGGQVAAGASLGARALAGARGAGGIGGLMGVGGQKGQDYEAVKQALLSQGESPEVAEQKAQEVAAYSLQNAPRQAVAGGAGALEGIFGIENILANAARKVGAGQGAASLTPPQFKQKLGAVASSTLGEALPEAAQAAVGQVGTNIALNQAGVAKDLTDGLAGTVAHDALVGSVLGLAVSPLQVSNLQRQYKQSLADDQARKQAEADAKVQAEAQKAEAERAVLQKQTDEIQKQMEQQQAIALPAPAEEIPVEEVQTDPLKNPLGNIRKSEVPFDIYKQIDDYRKQAGLPKLKEYSLEDFVDAMPGQNPKAEQALLDQLITAKSGYAGEKYTATQILEQAGLKKIDTKTQGFKDFLTRTTGVNALEQMSQPQLHAAFKALASLPAATTSTILPEGTNASRYDEKQYDKAIKGVDFLLAELGVPVDPKEVIKTIKEYTNLTEDSHAGAILDAAIKNGDVDLIKTPRYEIYDPKSGNVLPSTYTSRTAARAAAAKRGLNVRQITTDAIAAPTTSATLPEGFDIREGAFKEGEAPAGYELYAGDTLLSKSDTIDEANAKKASSERTRAGMALRFENQIKQLNNAIEAGQKRLDSSEARGEGQSTNFQKAAGRQAKLVAETQAKIASLTEQIQKLDPKITPLEIKPTANKAIGRKGFTVFEQGQARATYPSRQAAEESILADMDDKQLQELAQQQGRRAVGKKAQAELERRTPKAPTAAEAKRFAEQKPVSEVLEGIETEAKAAKAKAEEAKISPETRKRLADLEAKLKPVLEKLGLGAVKLNILEKMDQEGSYNESLIKIALNEKDPVRVLRHESLHALKDLNFFTPQQWTALTRMAKDQWITKYLKNTTADYKGRKTSRYDAYVDLYNGDMDKVTEEAIADAFADFANNKPPTGMLAALLKRMRDFFTALRNAFNNAGFQTYEDIFGQVERGELKAGQPQGGVERLSVKEYQTEMKQAKAYEKANGIMPYVSEPIDELPTDSPRYSLQSYNPDKHLSFDPTLGVPINKDGTVTVYYHTTKENALRIAQNRMIPSDGRALIFLTNESGGDAILKNRGNFDQDLDGSTVLVYVTPDQLQVDEEYDNGRRDFFIPLAEGDYFANKMKLQSIQKSRREAITDEFSYGDHEERITKAVNDYKAATPAERRKLVSTARKLLKKEHNVGSLLTENGKLEKTRIGDYNISYDGYSVASQGLGLASAQNITDKVNTCPRSAICEGLCLGETSGGNFMFGGAAQEDVGDIEKSAFRAGARMMQYLKTEALIVNPEAFVTLLQGEIDSLAKWCASPTQIKVDPETKKRLNVEKELYAPAIRLNVTSDFKPTMFRGLIESNPDVMFYDYTKLGSESIADNHHLTYSSTGFGQIVGDKKVFFKDKSGKYDHNWATMRERLKNGQNVAMAFSSKSGLPRFLVDTETGLEFQVLDGDDYDARFLDEKSAVKEASGGKGVIVGLRNKAGNMSEKNATVKTEGFFVQYDPKTDGDTVVVPNQLPFKLAKAEAKAKPEAPSTERASLQQASDIGNTNAYTKYNSDVRYSLRDSTDPDTLARVNETTTAREEQGYVQRITKALGGDTFSELRARSLNRYNRLSDVDKEVVKKRGGAALMADESAEAGALQSDLAAGVTASVLGVHDRNGGIPIYVNGVTKAFNDGGKIKGPVAIFAPLSKYNDPLIYQLYQFWAGVKRGSRLNAQGKPDIFTEDDVKRAEALEAKHPEFDQIQKEWTTFNNGLVQYLVDTGVLSEGDKARFTEFSDYIPFYRQMEGEKTIGPNIFQSISGVKKPKKLSEGTDKAPLADFLETIVRNTQSSIQMGMKNVAAQRAIDRALEIEMAERLRPNAPTGLDTVQVLEKGQVVTYQVADHLFIDAVKSLNMPELPFIGLLSGPANFLRNMVTKDPGFMLANMVRDSMAAYVTSGVKMTPIVDTISNFGKAMAGTSPEFEALLNAGIGGGYEFSQNIEMSAKAFEKELNKKYEGKTLFQRILNPMTAPTSLWEALEKGTTASDMATRIEVYKRTLEETGNEAEALHRALEVMNFNRKGSSPIIRIMTAAIPFLNARMQGLDVLYRASFGEMNNKDAAMIQKRFIVRGMTMFALSAMYWTLTHDDEEYKKQEQETKDNNWLIPSLGIKIPIPFEIGVIFKVIPERIMASLFGDDTSKDFMDSMARNLRSTLAIDYLPQAIKPFVETETNFSLFTRRPIVGQGLEGVAPEFQIGPGTSSLAAFAGSNLGMSPMKIDHLIGGYTGTMGMYMVSALDGIMNMNAENPNASKRFEQLPFIKRFALDPEARGTVTGYYDLKNATDEVVRTSSLLERTMNFEERGKFMQENIKLLANKDYILDLEKTMKNFRQMQVMIRSSNMDADAKREALLRINQAQNALTANINTLRANVM